MTAHISSPVFWQRAWFWAGRQWFVVRRRTFSTGLYRVEIECSRKWGASLFVEFNRWRYSIGVTGPQVLDLAGNVAGSVLGPARYPEADLHCREKIG